MVCVHTTFFAIAKAGTSCASDSRLYNGLADRFLPEPCGGSNSEERLQELQNKAGRLAPKPSSVQP